MRKASEMHDFDDDDYNEDEDIEIDNIHQDDIPFISSSSSSTTTTRSTTITSTITIPSTTTSSRINNQQTEMIESKISKEKSMTISSSPRIVPLFMCLFISISSLYRYIHVNHFLF